MQQMNIYNYLEQPTNYEITIEDLYKFLNDKFSEYKWEKDASFKGFVYRTKKREVHASITNMYDGSIKLGCGFQNKGGSWHGCCGTVNNYEILEKELNKYLKGYDN